MSKTKIGFYTAVSIVIASMVGTGVFTSIGFQVIGITTPFAILLLWLVGGIMALCGALVYGEIGAAFPENGGEYNYLSKLYHPVVGFLSGWVSSTVGFAAPVALAAMALGTYTQGVYPTINAHWLATAVVVLLTGIHAYDLKWGATFQKWATTIKVSFIVIFIFCGLLYQPSHTISVLPTQQSWLDIVGSEAFAVSLFWVSYSYSGWNASAYITGEIEQPNKNLPRSLFVGTLVVTILYMALNYVFLYTTPIGQLKGQLDVGLLSGNHIFGNQLGSVIGLVIAFLLLSSISAMTLAGPRVSASIGRNLAILSFLNLKNKKEVPFLAVIIQSAIAILLIHTSTFERVLELIGFMLTLFTFLTVLGVFILRFKFKTIERPYKTWGYPITPLIFLGINSWILYYGFISKKEATLYGTAILGVGLLIWIIGQLKNKSLTR